MSTDKSRFVVSADWVEKQLGTAGFRVVDASWYLPAHKRNGAEEYAAGHLPGAVFFDQDKIADHTTGLPHSLPSPEFFAEQAGALGLSDTDTIVVYDGPGFFSAPRVWWMLRVMGVRKAYVLDGGLDGWKREGRPKNGIAGFDVHFDPDHSPRNIMLKDCRAENTRFPTMEFGFLTNDRSKNAEFNIRLINPKVSGATIKDVEGFAE